jgi:hypothetical protein
VALVLIVAVISLVLVCLGVVSIAAAIVQVSEAPDAMPPDPSPLTSLTR